MVDIINIGNILTIKLHAPLETFDDISKEFMQIKNSSDNYDYEIFCKNCDIIKEIELGRMMHPFRNSLYLVNQKRNKIIAYSPKQKYSAENLVIREDKKITILSKEDIGSKSLIRLMRELLIRKLLEKKYFPLHASCVSKNDKADLFLGKKGSGKSTALFANVLLNDACPVSNDITFVGKENDMWQAYGLPYDFTFDKSLFYQTNHLDFLKNAVKTPLFGSDKVRFEAQDFIKTFDSSWVWSAPISSINLVNLSKENPFYEQGNISYENALYNLNEYGKDKNFSFDDFLLINNLYPFFEYELLAKDVTFNKIEGNILKHYLRRK